MPPQVRGPQSGPTAEDQSDTGPDTVTADDTAGRVPRPSAEAATTGGPKWIRCVHPGDRFVLEPGNDKGVVVTGEWQEFTAGKAKDVIAAARANGVAVLVADKEN